MEAAGEEEVEGMGLQSIEEFVPPFNCSVFVGEMKMSLLFL